MFVLSFVNMIIDNIKAGGFGHGWHTGEALPSKNRLNVSGHDKLSKIDAILTTPDLEVS